MLLTDLTCLTKGCWRTWYVPGQSLNYQVESSPRLSKGSSAAGGRRTSWIQWVGGITWRMYTLRSLHRFVDRLLDLGRYVFQPQITCHSLEYHEKTREYGYHSNKESYSQGNDTYS